MPVEAMGQPGNASAGATPRMTAADLASRRAGQHISQPFIEY